MFVHFMCRLIVCLCQALDALDRALQQNPSDLTVRAELYFSKGNQLREMNQLDRAFEVLYSLSDAPLSYFLCPSFKHVKMFYSLWLLISTLAPRLMDNILLRNQ